MISILLAIASLAAPPLDPQWQERVVSLGVRPMAAPRPALKYQLLPEVRELQPGNPVQWYLRCFAEQRNFFFNKEVVAERARYRTMPLKDLPADKLRGYGGSALTQADWGARLDTPDWQVLDRVQSEGTDLHLPELSSLRVLAAALQVRFRGEVARRDFDAAIRTAKTMFAFARHLGEFPSSAANQLGITVAEMVCDTLEEMVQQPGSPNLYWALTDLPSPLVDLRKGLQGDRASVAAELRSFREDAALTSAEIDELVGRLSGRAGFAREQAGRTPRNLRARLTEQAKDAERLRVARARLIESGGQEGTIAKLPAVQIILLVEKLEYELRRDDELKFLGLAVWQLDALAGKAQQRDDNIFEDLLPRVVELRRAQAALERRIALLRHVEALRLHSAAHDGKLPVKLDEVEVPLPHDPLTGNSFVYKLDDRTAHLRGGAPKIVEAGAPFNLRYEIIITK